MKIKISEGKKKKKIREGTYQHGLANLQGTPRFHLIYPFLVCNLLIAVNVSKHPSLGVPLYHFIS